MASPPVAASLPFPGLAEELAEGAMEPEADALAEAEQAQLADGEAEADSEVEAEAEEEALADIEAEGEGVPVQSTMNTLNFALPCSPTKVQVSL